MNFKTFLYILIFLGISTSAGASSQISCDLSPYSSRTYALEDMPDDPFVTDESIVFNEDVWGYVFGTHNTDNNQLNAEAIYFSKNMDVIIKSITISSFRSKDSGRCVWKVEGQAEGLVYSNFTESFELIAKLGNETLWFGDKNETGGEIFSYLELDTSELETEKK